MNVRPAAGFSRHGRTLLLVEVRFIDTPKWRPGTTRALIAALSLWGTFLTCQYLEIGEARHVRNVPHALALPAFREVMIEATAASAQQGARLCPPLVV